MKKFRNKISTNQWCVTVPNLNSAIFRKSTGSCQLGAEKQRVSSGSYDVPAAQREYDLAGRVTSASRHSLPAQSGSSSTGSYQDACQEGESAGELYDVVDVRPSVRIVESCSLTASNNRYEYDVPKIHFCFIEQQQQLEQARQRQKVADIQGGEGESGLHDVDLHDYENQVDDAAKRVVEYAQVDKGSTNYKHRSQVQIYVTSESHAAGCPTVKFGSDPNLTLASDDDDDGDARQRDARDSDGSDACYKVPRRRERAEMTAGGSRLSRSLHDFHADELDLPQLSLSRESIEHVSCSQVLARMDDESVARPSSPAVGSAPSESSRKAARRWDNFKAKFERFNRAMEDQAAAQRVGAFQHNAINLEVMYRASKDRCRRILNRTGQIFKRQDGGEQRAVRDHAGQMVKNDAFFAKITANDIEYVLPQREGECGATSEEGSALHSCSAEGRRETRKGRGESDNCDCAAQCENSDEPKEVKSFKMSDAWSRQRISGAIAEEVMLVRNNFRKSRLQLEGQNGFEDLRRYVKQGGDFAKELAAILQERSEAELQYSKSLSKLSVKLSRACREGVGGLNEAWKAVAIEMETRAEAHRQMSNVLLEETAKPLKILSENQHRQRKNSEAMVDKAAKMLSEWRVAEGKSKKHSHACARDNEKLQDAMLENRMARSTSLIQLPNIHKNSTDKDNAKLEGKKRKAEDAVKKADIEYYSHCVRSERARLEWESAVLKGASTFQTLEEDRLNSLKTTLNCYLKHNAELTPKLEEAVVQIRMPIETAEAQKDLSTFLSLRQSSQQTSEQLLPDFYCEHITLAMNRERRKQALVKLLQLIKLDIERERKAKYGLENLSKAIKQTPNFGAEDSQQTVAEKLYHMKSMLTYLEGAKYKVQSALAELDCRPRTGHPLASHITITRDKAGLQQSILKAPLWLREQWTEGADTKNNKHDHQRQHNGKDGEYDVENNWIDRGMADGNSNQHDSDFDEFSSQGSSICGGHCQNDENIEQHIENVENVQPIAECKALYLYTPNLPDELAIRPGDKVVVYRQQEDGWWLGECNGAVGIFPATYVETVKT